jgi:hypothetical protein
MDGVKEAHCRTCERFTPLLEEPLVEDKQNEYPWGNLMCGEYSSILLTVRLTTSARPKEPERMTKRAGP